MICCDRSFVFEDSSMIVDHGSVDLESVDTMCCWYIDCCTLFMIDRYVSVIVQVCVRMPNDRYMSFHELFVDRQVDCRVIIVL